MIPIWCHIKNTVKKNVCLHDDMYVMFTNLIMLFLLKNLLTQFTIYRWSKNATMSDTPRSGIAPSSIGEDKKSIMIYICGECHQVRLIMEYDFTSSSLKSEVQS